MQRFVQTVNFGVLMIKVFRMAKIGSGNKGDDKEIEYNWKVLPKIDL
jgi:hypothetical protein